MSQQPNNLEQTVRNLQIITFAMVVGVVFLAGITVFLMGALDDPADGILFSGLAAAFAAVAFLMHLAIPAAMVRRQARSTSLVPLCNVYLGKTIIGLAILEGAAFLNILVVNVEHNWWSLAIAGGLVFWMLAMFPTRTRVAHWVENQQFARAEGQ